MIAFAVHGPRSRSCLGHRGSMHQWLLDGGWNLWPKRIEIVIKFSSRRQSLNYSYHSFNLPFHFFSDSERTCVLLSNTYRFGIWDFELACSSATLRNVISQIKKPCIKMTRGEFDEGEEVKTVECRLSHCLAQALIKRPPNAAQTWHCCAKLISRGAH